VLTDHWPGGDGSDVVLAVRFAKVSKRDIQPAQRISADGKTALTGSYDRTARLA